MDRLVRYNGINYEVAGTGGRGCAAVCEENAGCETCPIETAFARLAAYEDIGTLEQLAARVEVVRCAGCKYSSEQGGYDYPGQSETHVNCQRWLTRQHEAVIMPNDGFCSYGQRRED
ncbi:hypothetical protein LJB76_02480 [Clostridia bacterium OttesenSCG-928-O13]|nr:hypothetical protein [Clostridia bacterium OttesenSCG-928-O13]